VPLNDEYPLAVTFITSPASQGDGSSALEPIGTGFVVNLRSRIEGLTFEYVVTAAHVVEGRNETYARIRTRDGGSKDLRVHDWLHHPKADVAVAPFRPGGHTDLHLLHVPGAGLSWYTSPRWVPVLGDRVYFIGLLALPAARSMVERNVPMVRSGTIGAMYQADVPVEWPDKSIRKFEAHLIDCRSYGGFSGSPCFFQRDDQVTAVKEGAAVYGPITFLFGLVSGHFDQYASPKVRGDIAEVGSISVPVNTGVGVVTPVERIVEVLRMEELSDERKRIEDEREKRGEEGAALDRANDESEFERFEHLTRELVNTPKPKEEENGAE
jgi:hypothetical protein